MARQDGHRLAPKMADRASLGPLQWRAWLTTLLDGTLRGGSCDRVRPVELADSCLDGRMVSFGDKFWTMSLSGVLWGQMHVAKPLDTESPLLTNESSFSCLFLFCRPRSPASFFFPVASWCSFHGEMQWGRPA